MNASLEFIQCGNEYLGVFIPVRSQPQSAVQTEIRPWFDSLGKTETYIPGGISATAKGDAVLLSRRYLVTGLIQLDIVVRVGGETLDLHTHGAVVGFIRQA